MMCLARNSFEQERRLKQYQEMILCICLLYLTFCQLSIAHYNKHHISLNGLKHNKCFFPKETYSIWFDRKAYNFSLSRTFYLERVTMWCCGTGLEDFTFFKCRRVVLLAHDLVFNFCCQPHYFEVKNSMNVSKTFLSDMTFWYLMPQYFKN